MLSAALWAVEEASTGSQCLFAWNNVCKPKKLGGLGLKILHQENRYVCIKFVVKALLPSTTPCLDWIILQHRNAFAPKSHQTMLCKTINCHMPDLQKNSFALTNNGSLTYFWYDPWLLPDHYI